MRATGIFYNPGQTRVFNLNWQRHLSLPEERRVDDRPRLLGGLQNDERLPDNRTMSFSLIGRTKWSAKRKMHEERSRRFHVLGYLPAHHDADSRNAGFFEYSSDQSHGLLADRSTRDQQGRLSIRRQQPVGGCRRSHFDQLPRLG